MAASTLSPVTADDFDFYAADYARSILMHDLQQEMVAFFASDDELDEMIAETYRFTGWNACEGKYEINEIGYNDWRFGMLTRVQEQRFDRRRVEAELAAGRAAVAAGPLSYNPFAALAAA